MVDSSGFRMSPKVLIVDDEQTISFIVQEILDRNGFTTKSVDNARDALKELEVEEYALLLLDYNMPEMNGLELLQEVRSRNINSEAVILSGYPSYSLISEFIHLNIYDFLVKPASSAIILHTCKRAIEKYFLVEDNRLAQEDVLAKNIALEKSLCEREKEILEHTLIFAVLEKIRNFSFEKKETQLSFLETSISSFFPAKNFFWYQKNQIPDHSLLKIADLQDNVACELNKKNTLYLDTNSPFWPVSCQVKSVFFLPVFANGSLEGILELQEPDPLCIQKTRVIILEAFASLIGLAIFGR